MNKSPKMQAVEDELGVDLKSYMYDLYVTQKLSTCEIAEKLSIGKTTARSWIEFAGIKFRSISGSQVIKFAKMTPEERVQHTSKAKARVDYLRENGLLEIDYSHLKGPDAHQKRPDVRKKNSDFQRNWKDRPKPNPEALARMRKSMEQVLRDRATPQEKIFKKAIESLGYFPKFQHNEGTSILDFAFVDLKIGIELDGIPHMTFPKKREQDKRQDEELERDGWIILRFFNVEIEEHLGECLREVIELVEAHKRLHSLMKEAK